MDYSGILNGSIHAQNLFLSPVSISNGSIIALLSCASVDHPRLCACNHGGPADGYANCLTLPDCNTNPNAYADTNVDAHSD
jgi:hypothetical protein